MERETGIEPATNSLEGCDSTTELLPRSRWQKMVAREGLEPSKPLGRQIYSLLRLTAPQPRQLSALESSTLCLSCGPDCPHQTQGPPPGLVRWSWRRDLNPRPADYKSAALPTELRQHRQNSNTNTRVRVFQPSLDDFLSPESALTHHFIQHDAGRH